MNQTLCFLGADESSQLGVVKNWDKSHVEVRSGKAFAIAMTKAENDPRAWVLESLWKEGDTGATTREQPRRVATDAFLCGFTPMQRKAYHASATKEEEATATTLKDEFAQIQMSTLPNTEVDVTDPPHKEWCDALLRNTAKYKCLREMPPTVPMKGDPVLTIRDKDGVSNTPPHRQYKMPRHLIPELEKFIREMLEKKWIEPSTSDYCSPVLIIPKPNGKGYRFVVDLRQVNERTKRENYYIPDLSAMFEKLKGSKYMSCLDLRAAYWQASLDPATKHKTAFTCELGSFQYRVVPMGLLHSAQFYQRFIETKLDRHGVLYRKVHLTSDLDGTYVDEDGVRCRGWCGAYLDDIIVFSKDANRHRQHLTGLFDVLSKENLYLNPDKCNLFCKYVRFLGCVVGQNKIFMDGDKVKAIIDMPEPKRSQSEVRSFLGAISFYRNWISDFSDLAEPLTALLKGKDKKIPPEKWTKRQSDAVLALKKAITRYPVLRQFDPSKQIYVVTDASDYAIGGCLFQYHDGKPCAVQYISRQLIPAERNYDVREKECLAVKHCLDKLRHYLLCTRFTVKCLSDHKSLSYLKKGKETGGRIARWALALEEYDYEVEYIKGKDNDLADVLSRMVAAQDGQSEDPPLARGKATLTTMEPHVAQACVLHHCAALGEGERSAQERVYDLEDEERLLGMNQPIKDSTDRDGGLRAIKADPLWWDNGVLPHEALMFTAVRYRQSIVQIKPEHYEKCPDFKDIYAECMRGMEGTRNRSKKLDSGEVEKVDFAATAKKPTYTGSTDPTKQEGGIRSSSVSRDGRSANASPSNAKDGTTRGLTYLIRDGLLYASHPRETGIGERVCVPSHPKEKDGESQLRSLMVKEIHSNSLLCHLGANRTYEELRRRAYWPKMRDDVEHCVATCEECQRFKLGRRKPQGHMMPLQIPLRPGTHYSIDFMTGLPKSGRQLYDAILVVVDRYSKKVRCLPTWKKADGKVVAELFVNNIILGPDGNGVPTEIISDRDTRFTPSNSKAKTEGFWREFFQHIGTSICLSTSRHQRTDGQTERMIAHIQDMLRIGVDYRQSNWARLLPRIVFTLNSTVARSTGFSPFFVERGREPLLPLDRDAAIRSSTNQREDTQEFLARIWDIESRVHEKLLRASEWSAKAGNTKVREASSFQPRDKVWVSTNGITMPWDKDRRSKKLTARYYGPFEVIRQTSPVTYELKLPQASNIHPIFHVSLLKPYKGHKQSETPFPKPTMDDEYEIESILAHRTTSTGARKYLVKWKGYTYEESTWEPASNFKPHTLRDYHLKRKRDREDDSGSDSSDNDERTER